MARVCELTGVKPLTGNLVSHSNIKTRTRWLPNLRKKKYMIPELSQSLTVVLSTRAIRTIDKLGGLAPAVLNAKEAVLSEQLGKLRRSLVKARKAAGSK